MKATTLNLLLLSAAASAAPTIVKRADIDSTILNYALTLEHLEATFYAEAVKNFTAKHFKEAGFSQPLFYKNLEEIARDEATHVDFLTTAIKAAGYTPVQACTYNFGDLTAKTFAQTASIIEGVGVSAYLGAAAQITNKTYLTAAGSILTVESRHNAFWRNNLVQSPFPQPFDVPLDFDQVYSLAAPFIVACPSTNPKLPVKAFPTLTVATKQSPIPQGATVQYDVAADTKLPSGPLYVAFPLVTGPVFEPATVEGSCIFAKIPTGSNGPAGESYAVLTTSNSSLTDDNTVAGPAVVAVTAPYLA
ncbi:MAG: hypothetical protein M1820_002332 [Bogoriella megaspora]|nr:MAG: hypothetical protein M1820_002332 [Bogoriella megaspora]